MAQSIAFARSRLAGICFVLLVLIGGWAAPAAPVSAEQPAVGLGAILQYIHANWDVLTRSMTKCDSVTDPKLPEASVLYLPADFPEPESVKKMESSCRVRVLPLPSVIHHPGQPEMESVKPEGLLFLPQSYVVPGGRFNEMYGWDSYFIVVGLLNDGRVDLARNIVENFFFEIEHYGTVLNANRTYYLTRSQPPFLTSMVLAVFDAEKKAGQSDHAWLEHAYQLAVQDYQLWTHEPHLAGSTGLSRYYDFGNGPAPESLQDEVGLRRKVAGYFLLHPDLEKTYIIEGPGQNSVGSTYAVQVCDIAGPVVSSTCDAAGHVALSTEYFKGDRSMRESGFDISFRFKPYGAATHHFAPVCLNSLLYKTEKDLETMAHELGKADEAAQWKAHAGQRKALVDRYLWNAQRGLFFDYDFESGKQSTYQYLTTFYPLWSGMATSEQAQAVVANLRLFEQPAGLATSTENSGGQWDYPFGWAPLHLLAVDGLRRYGYEEEGDRISYKFLLTVLQNYRREGTIREKYNVVTGSSDAPVTAGYNINVVGFGWTNGVFLQLLHELPTSKANQLSKE
jgi:alpha,alpha-trehalase